MPPLTIRPSDAQHSIYRIAATSRGQSLQVWISRALDAAALRQGMEGDGPVRADAQAGISSNGAPAGKRRAKKGARR